MSGDEAVAEVGGGSEEHYHIVRQRVASPWEIRWKSRGTRRTRKPLRKLANIAWFYRNISCACWRAVSETISPASR